MKLNESILSNLKEEASTSIWEFAKDCEVNDFIADGTFSYEDKINYIADILEESGNVDSYKDTKWNDYLLNVSKILKDAANKIKVLDK